MRLKEHFLMRLLLKKIYETKKGEVIYSEPGDRSVGDKRLYIGYNGIKWAHTLELIGAALRAKAYVEDNNYKNGMGRYWLFGYITNCICTDIPIQDLMKKI
jgi:hypothetical protein